MNTTSQTFLGRLKDKDYLAREQLYRIYIPRIWGKVVEVLHRLRGIWLPADWLEDGHPFATDICHEVVCKVLESISTFEREKPGSFRTWLDVIVTNRIRQELRYRRNRSPAWSQEKLDSVYAQLPDPAQDVQVFTDAEYHNHRVGIVLAWLRQHYSEEEIQAYLRLVWKEATTAEIAEERGMSDSRVHMWRFRLQKKLRAYLDEFFPDLRDEFS